MSQPKQSSLDRFLWNRIIDYLHSDTTEFTERLMIANRGSGNTIINHICTCRRCRKELDEVVVKGANGCLEGPR